MSPFGLAVLVLLTERIYFRPAWDHRSAEYRCFVVVGLHLSSKTLMAKSLWLAVCSRVQVEKLYCANSREYTQILFAV